MRATAAYLVISTPRSGSTLLCRALKDTNLAGRPQEYFRPDGKLRLQRWNAASPIDYFDGLLAERVTPNGVFGAKISWRQLRLLEDGLRNVPRYQVAPMPTILADLFPALRYVRITRRDKLRQAISFLKALQTGVWGQRPGKQETPSKPTTFDYDALWKVRRMLDEHEAGIDGFFTQAGVQPFTVVYEDLVDAYQDTVAAVLSHIGIVVPTALALPEPRIAKLADAESDEWVERFVRIARDRSDALGAGEGP